MTNTLKDLLDFAKRHSYIEQVGTEGSSNNPHINADQWQDYDLTYFCNNPNQFNLEEWLTTFGDPIIYQHFKESNLFGTASQPWSIYLVRFAGYLRIDLKIAPSTDIPTYLAAESLNKLIWSRHGVIQPTETSDSTFQIQQPTQSEFDATINEFYFCAGNVVKGLARKNLLYATGMNQATCQQELLQLLNWKIALHLNAPYNPGAYNKFMAQYLDSSTWQQLQKTYQQNSLANAKVALKDELEIAHQAIQEIASLATTLTIPSYLQGAEQQLLNWLTELT